MKTEDIEWFESKAKKLEKELVTIRLCLKQNDGQGLKCHVLIVEREIAETVDKVLRIISVP
jgi:hypothetical protein